jgi:exodeoxyribonuclease VII large subunit
VVWAFAPVQDRHAAPAITRALQDLAACADVEAIVVARGGGSLADLFAFCDETLCRTVALLRVPVISSVGHHTDRALLDDVAAVACSTPTHAAEAAVPLDCLAARRALAASAARLERQSRRAIAERARTLARLSRAPAAHVERHRTRLHQHLRELRASARRGIAGGERLVLAHSSALSRKASAASLARERGAQRALTDAASLNRAAALDRRRRDLDRFLVALAAHDPQRTLERGYALVEDRAGEPVVSAAAARGAPSLVLRLHDGRVPVRPEPPVD